MPENEGFVRRAFQAVKERLHPEERPMMRMTRKFIPKEEGEGTGRLLMRKERKVLKKKRMTERGKDR